MCVRYFRSKWIPILIKNTASLLRKKIYLLLSDLSDHTENLKINKKVSIYFAQEEIHKEKLNNPRLTLLGSIEKLELNKNDELFRKLLKNYILIEKSAKMWGEFLDFNFYEFNIKNSLYVKGFGKAYKEVH